MPREKPARRRHTVTVQVLRRGPGSAGRPHGRAARRHLRAAAMKTSEASGISRESVATVVSGIRPSRLPERGGPARTIHAGWRKLIESADSLAIRLQRKRRQPPDPQVWNPRRLTGGDLEVKT